MRIALFCETYLPYINGVVTHVKTLRDGLVAQGHQVLVVTADCNAKHHYIQDGILHCPAICTKHIYGYSLAMPASRRRYEFIKQFDPDVIHIHDEYGVSFSAISMARHLDKPLVYTIHTMYDQYLYYISPRRLIPLTKRLVHRYNRFVAGRASAITGPSLKCQSYLREIGLKTPVTVVPNAVELELFEKAPENAEAVAQLRRRWALEGKTAFAFVGRLGKEKNVNALLEWIAKTIRTEDNVAFLIVGDGPAKKELEQQAQALGISSMVHFPGCVPHEQLAPYYRCCKAYITASLSDTNSISMKEAMACGLPVLHIRDPQNEGQIVSGVNGFIYQTPQELARLILQVRDMPAKEWEALRSSTIRSAEQFSSAALADRLMEVYSRVCHRPS